ncbi:hypothetical protein L3X38_033142 [Prunus dulcis]|uniref:Retrotransposon gag domain-containing protein n=1 Tax=Prunus dulcis TaxID=3755 RepID=A0AAD4YWP5_PRUDU|nr:hypothetical protein L3X38_033142 [Prunus dulcis]
MTLASSSLTIWDAVAKKFLEKFFSTQKKATLRGQIFNFKQDDGQPFNECLERFKGLLQCPHHGLPLYLQMQIFCDGLTQTCQSTVDNATCGALKKKNAQESYDIYEMLGSNAQHKDTRGKHIEVYEMSSNNDLALQVASLEKKLDFVLNMAPKIAKVCAICNIPGHPTYQCSASEAYPKFVQEQVNLTNSYNQRPRIDPFSNTYNPGPTQEENEKPNDDPSNATSLYEAPNFHKAKKHYTPPIPFPGRLAKSKNMPAYGKFFKELNTYKRKYGPNEKVMVSENVSVVLQRKLPPKLKDLGCFSINITIGDKLAEKAMHDLGAIINLIPNSVYLQLGLGGLKATTISLQLANQSVKYPREKESRVVLSVKMVSQHQSKDSGSKKNEGEELKMVAPQDKSSKKMKFASSSAETEPTSQTTISDDSKTGRGMSTMPRVVKRKLQKLRPIVEYNKRGKGIGQAHSEMQSYIGVLARSRVPLVGKKWSKIPKDIKEQIWEAVDMAFVIREKLEYNHRLSRKGYAGLEDELEETMPGVEIDRSTLWKRARQDKHGNIPDPKVAEKAKIIDELQKQVSEGKVSVYGSNDVLTMALGPEHPGRVRAVGSGISPRQYFNLPKPQRVSFDDRLKDSLRVLLQEETKKMEAKAREEALRMEARTKQLVEAEREHILACLNQELAKVPKIQCLTKQAALVVMGNIRKKKKKILPKMGNIRKMKRRKKKRKKKRRKKKRRKKMKKSMTTRLFKFTQFAGVEEIGATVVAVYMRYLHDVLKKANMTSMVGFIDPATVSANSGTIADRSRLVAGRLQKTDGEPIFMMPYNPGLVSLTGFCFYDFQ